jgi:DNA polymerase-3 subunit alpha
LEKDVTTFCGHIDRSLDKQTVIIAGMVSQVRRIITKNDQPMAFVRVEDLQGNVEVVVFPKVYDKTRQLWQPDNVLLIRGNVQVRQDEAKVICESAVDYQSWTEERGEDGEGPTPKIRRQLHVTIPRSGDQERDIKLLGETHATLTGYAGQDLFSIYVPRDGGVVQLMFPNDRTEYSPALETAINDLLGEGHLRVERI